MSGSEARTTERTVREARRDDPEEAARLADLWNVSDLGWPGGSLLQGVPMTAERMREQLRWRELILILVAEADGEIIGYVGVKRDANRDGVAHGATITVRPDWQGKGCGKALLLAVLDRLTEMGYQQYRRATWSGNLKAIPLYKKIGDFWEPGTNVRLQNFIPTARTLDIARGFFARHGWYESFRRELTVAPDEIRWHGIRVYPYHFEAGDDLFIMMIDPQAEAPTAIETSEVYVACHLGVEEVVCGLPYTLTWEIINQRDDGRPLRVELAVESPLGIGLSVTESLEVTDSLLLERRFVVPPGIEPPKPGLPQHAIRSTFLLDGVPVVLAMGFRTAQPIEIDVQGVQPSPGKPGEEVVVRLYNRLKVAVRGEVCFERRPGLTFDRQAAPFTVPAASWGTCRFRLTAGEGSHTTHIRAVLPPELNPELSLAAPLETRAKPVTFRSAPFDRAYAWEDEERGVVTIETPAFWVDVHLRSGAFSVHERLSGQRVMQQALTPVGSSLDGEPETLRCRHRLETVDGRVRLTQEIPSNEGLIIERMVTVGAGPFLRLDHRVHNATGATLRPALRLPTEFLLHRGVTVPLAGGLVHEIVEGLGDFPLPAGGDLPTDPTAYSEGWSAREEHGLVAGIVWKTCGEIDGGSVRLDFPAIAPRSSSDADPLHLVVARGDWEVVRDLWRRLWQPGGIREEQRPAVHPVLSAGFEPDPPLVTAKRTPASLAVRNRRLKPFAGRWELRAEGFQSEPSAGELPEVTPRSPATQDLVLTCTDLTPRVAPATFHLSSEATLDEREAPIVIVGDAARAVTVEAGERFEVDNGWLSFAVAPGHHGAMISLQREGRELLVSSFPEPRPYQWMAAWFGGVEPFLQQPGDVRHVRDSFTGEPVERFGACGLGWRGVRVDCRVRHPGTRWLAFSVEYLTTGASNLVALVQRLTNRSGAPQEVPAGFIVFPAMTAETRVHYDVRRPDYQSAGETWARDVALRQRASRPPSFRFGDAPWVAVGTEGSLLTLISFPPPGEAGSWLIDSESAGLHTSVASRLEPGETQERLAWLVVAEDPRQAQAYQVLNRIRALP
jgi:GNAT superfamily N-acetyltransferase